MAEQLENLRRLAACIDRVEQFRAAGQLPEEAEALREAIALAPEVPGARQRLALIYVELDDMFHLAQVLVAWQKEDPGTYPEQFASKQGVIASALTVQGLNIKIKTGDNERVLKYCMLAVQLDPDDKEVLYNFGDSLDDCGKSKDAEKVFERLVHLYPGYADAWNTLGFIREKRLNMLSSAIECYEKAVECDPNLERARTNLRRATAESPSHLWFPDPDDD